MSGALAATDRRQAARQALSCYRETGDQAALEAVVEAHQGLALSLAGRFAQRGEELDDLNQVALLGLLKAVERFDPARGTELTTFATATILGELKRHLRDRAWSVRPPRRVHDLYIAAQQAIDELSQLLGRSPTVHEVACHLDAEAGAVLEALEAGGLRNSAPLDAMVSGGDEAHLGPSSARGDDPLAQVEGRLVLKPLLARLSERDRTVLQLRFGVGLSQTQIAELIGATQMQVSRALARCLAQLRAWSQPESR
jgi:RNA polymerase sigma-B factor